MFFASVFCHSEKKDLSMPFLLCQLEINLLIPSKLGDVGSHLPISGSHKIQTLFINVTSLFSKNIHHNSSTDIFSNIKNSPANDTN